MKKKYFILLIPFIFILVVELFLRIFSYGYSSNLFFIKKLHDDKKYVYLNKQIFKLYFLNDVNPDYQFKRFELKKNKDTVRILCFGGDGLTGYPYSKNLSIPSLTEKILNQNQDRIKYEFINLGFPGLDSSVILDLVKKTSDFNIDYYLIFTGYNEYYGPGACYYKKDSDSNTLNELKIKFRKFRIFQLIESVLYSKNNFTLSHRSFMNSMIKNNYVENNENNKRSLIKKYKRNLSKILKISKARKIKTILFTLPYNIKNCEPFKSVKERGFYYRKFKLNIDQSIINQTSIIDKNLLKKFVNKYTNDAIYNYIQACILYNGKKINESKTYFLKAVEFDRLKIRPYKSINEFLKSTKNKATHIFDLEKVLSVYSKNKIFGNKIFIDHINLNKRYRLIVSKELSKIFNPDIELNNKNFENLNYSIIDQIHAVLSCWLYYKGYPFVLNNYKNLIFIKQFFKIENNMLILKNKFFSNKNLFDKVLMVITKFGFYQTVIKSHQEAAKYYYDRKNYKKSKKELLIVFELEKENIRNLNELLHLCKKTKDNKLGKIIYNELKKIKKL